MKIINNDSLGQNIPSESLKTIDKINNGLPVEKVAAITRFVKNLVKLQQQGQDTIDSDALLNLAAKCFGSSVKQMEWTVDNAVQNICTMLQIPEEKRILIDNLISTFTE